MWIKQKQREYFDLFGEKLNVDFRGEVKFTKVEIVKRTNDLFNNLLEKYNVDIDFIRRKRISFGLENERNFITEFSMNVLNQNLNVAEAARLLNKDRSIIYHYAGKRIKQ